MAGSNAQRHAEESERAIRAMRSEFAWLYARLPRYQETCKVMYGMCWKSSATTETRRDSGPELSVKDDELATVLSAAAVRKTLAIQKQ